MLHLSMIGMARDDTAGDEAIGELEDLRWANVELAPGCRPHIRRCDHGHQNPPEHCTSLATDPAQTREVLRRARQVADAIGKPVMVHGGSTAIALDEILSLPGPRRHRHPRLPRA